MVDQILCEPLFEGRTLCLYHLSHTRKPGGCLGCRTTPFARHQQMDLTSSTGL